MFPSEGGSAAGVHDLPMAVWLVYGWGVEIGECKDLGKRVRYAVCWGVGCLRGELSIVY